MSASSNRHLSAVLKHVSEPIEVFALANDGFPIPSEKKLKGKLKNNASAPSLLSLAFWIGLLLLVGFAIWAHTNTFNVQTDTKEKKLAVLIFKNQTGKPELEVVGKMISDWTTQGLMQLKQLRKSG